ncbi:Lumican, putative [Pediculus humanus corporis]|uniref:Lumican, putative n=1 Tax=Pediculus humanus subsp. corporis TaxID=121224 RepID=E0VK91_PEDHC|nr:Lumican, putative [Pediculus humanus corporis]EEB13797.1 Lumican, putative [Pediculus humanus corporis]
MVKLTTKYLFRKISKKNSFQKKKKGETDIEYLNRVTHLHLQSQYIDKISVVPQCQSVKVIYLQNNLIVNLENLNNFPNLTHLYLQHNYINKMENINCLTSLKKLYLGYNEISVVEGLEGMKNLSELHLENQRLPQGETLFFDPRTISHLSQSLKILNLANNNIDSVSPLENLTALTKLIIDGNKLKNVKDFTETIYCWPFLEELNCDDNPMVNDRKYFDEIVVASKSLKILNGKQINEQTREFLTNLFNNRENGRKLYELSTRIFDSEEIVNKGIETESKIGSKLFPVLNELSKERKLFYKNSLNKSYTSVYSKTLHVTHINDLN